MSRPMKFPCPGILSAVSMFFLLPVVAAAPLTIHLSPDGRDDNDGLTPETAISSFQVARDRIRERRRRNDLPEGAVVMLAPGLYTLMEPLELTDEDAGTASSPTVFRGNGDARDIRISGGPAVNGFEPWKGDILRRDLVGTPLEGVLFSQLFFQGKRMPLARTPNEDPEDIHGGIWAHALGGIDSEAKRTFNYGNDIDPAKWSSPETAQIGIFCRFDWRWNRLPVKSVDPAEKLITLAREATYEITAGDRYFAYNILEELDAPGEWYLDRKKSVLYFRPPGPLATDVVTVSAAPGLFRIRRTGHIFFETITFEGSNGNAVELTGCSNCAVRKSIIRNCGGWGIVLDGGTGCTVEGCDISDVGQGGIRLSGGDAATLTAGNNQALNNVIHRNGVFEKTYNTGINIGGVGNRAAHNLIYDTPHAAMTLAGNDNIIEYNIVHHTNLQSTDTGGIYSCPRDWTQRGNTIRYNIWHDIGGFGKKSSWQPLENGSVIYEYPHFTWGIYMDDPTSGNTIFGNILYRVPICGLHNHGGRDNIFSNNVIVDCPAFQAGMLSENWTEWPRIIQRLKAASGPESPYLRRYPELAAYTEEHPEEMSGLRFTNNIIAYTEEGTRWLRERRGWGNEQLLYTLRERLQDAPRNLFEKNLIHLPPSLKLRIDLQEKPDPRQDLTWEQWQATGRDTNSLIADPLFVNPEACDFRLKPESPAWALGFQEIPVEKIGPYADPMRVSWPIAEDSRTAAKAEPVRLSYEVFEKIKAVPSAVRGGLRRSLLRKQAGGPVTIAYFGGGIHHQDGWRGKLQEWLTAQLAPSEVRFIDAGICDCVRGSSFSVYRFTHDVLDRDADLVLVDFASEDMTADPLAVEKNMEGIILQAWSRDPDIDLVFLYAFRAGYEEAYAEGTCPSAVSAFERVAQHYGVPSINMGYPVAQAVVKGEMAAKGAADGKPTFSEEGIRPGPEANALYTEALQAAFRSLLENGTGPDRRLPRVLHAGNLSGAGLMPVTEDMLDGTWEKLPVDQGPFSRFNRHFDTVWATTTPGSRLTFTFQGTDVSLFNLVGPDTGRVAVTVDGDAKGVRQSVDRWCYYNRLSGMSIASGLENGTHTVSLELLPDAPDRSEPIAEARRLEKYVENDFKGVALRLGWIRVNGAPPQRTAGK